MQKRYLYSFILILLGSTFCQSLVAQNTNESLAATILRKDSLFWVTYNTCDTTQFRKFFTEDVEFYHDKSGITLGLESLAAITAKNLCGTNNFRLRREVIEGSVKVYPLYKSNVVYGVILSGEHLFYVREAGKDEKLDGQAKFSHVWLLKDTVWKMARILSYDHGEPKSSNKKKEITLSNTILDQYAGIYHGPQSGKVSVKREGALLLLSVNDKPVTLYPEAENRFFVKDRDLSFEFIRGDKNKVSRMVVRENGKIVEEAVIKN